MTLLVVVITACQSFAESDVYRLPGILEEQIESLNDCNDASFKCCPKIVYYVMPIEGRKFCVTDASLKASYKHVVGAALGFQNIRARGRNRENRFRTDATNYEIWVAPIRIADHRLKFKYKSCRPKKGVFRTPDSLLILNDAKVDTVGLKYRFVQAEYSRVKHNIYASNVYALGGTWRKHLHKKLRLKLHGKGFFEKVYARDFHDSCKLMLGADLEYRPFKQLELTAGLVGFTNGLPFGGTVFNGATAFALARPSPIVDRIREKASAYLKLECALKLP
jgi:hypothetical protein